MHDGKNENYILASRFTWSSVAAHLHFHISQISHLISNVCLFNTFFDIVYYLFLLIQNGIVI